MGKKWETLVEGMKIIGNHSQYEPVIYDNVVCMGSDVEPNRLSDSERTMLEALGWVWNPVPVVWQWWDSSRIRNLGSSAEPPPRD